jgi:L-fucono-1,5-lactonase
MHITTGSDWPVCRLAGEYYQVMGIPFRFFEKLEVEVKEMILYKNAVNCYQLEI